jgi:thiamine pyrophosphate-dependent acetolactate synthase large subunit-like protein
MRHRKAEVGPGALICHGGRRRMHKESHRYVDLLGVTRPTQKGNAVLIANGLVGMGFALPAAIAASWCTQSATS